MSTVVGSETTELAISKYLGLEAELAAAYENFVRMTAMDSKCPQSEIAGHLWNMRASKYPAIHDYDEVTALANRYWFLEFGRFLTCLLGSLYLLPRRSDHEELVSLLRLRSYVGAATQFVLAAPAGPLAFAPRWMVDGSRNKIDRTSITLAIDRVPDGDRLWIKRVHWTLDSLRENLKLSDWLSVARQRITIAPAYLTGISWAWIDGIIKQLTIRPFIANAD